MEKFYCYEEWLKYSFEHFFEKENLILNWTVEFQGEYDDDHGIIEVKDNIVQLIHY